VEVPLTFNELNVVFELIVSIIVVTPSTNKLPLIFTLLKLEFPLIFNDDNIVVLLFNIVKPETFNEEYNVVLLLILVVPETFKLLDNNVSPLTFKANIPGPVVFILNPVAVIICLSNPFILYVILPEFVDGVGSPPLSSLINNRYQ